MDAMLLFGGVCVGGGLGAAAIGFGRAVLAQATSRRTLALVTDGDLVVSDELSGPLVGRMFSPLIARVAAYARAATPSWWLARLRKQTRLAGLGSWGIEGLMAMKAALGLAGAAVLPLIGAIGGKPLARSLLWAVVGGLAAFVIPDVWVARRAVARQNEIRRALPEALDLMAIAVTAGTGLEASIALVARRLAGPLGEELSRLLREIQLGASRKEALHGLRDRTDVPELGRFVLALVQADTLGSPLAEVLRAQASEMRMLRRQRAREQAAKTPVKLLVPLLLGIFPALGVVVMGPAIIQIARAFTGY